MAPVVDFTLSPRSPYPIPLTNPLAMIDHDRLSLPQPPRIRFILTPPAPRFVLKFRSYRVLLQRSRADVASNNGGHKTVRLAEKKGGSSNFIALLPVSFGNKAIKLSGARHLFLFFARRLFERDLDVF